jgi:nucleoside-diphosphate-sugar epimerase
MTMKERVLVTGAAGFIGSHLLPMLVKEGYEVIGLDNSDDPSNVSDYANVYIADICDSVRMKTLGQILKFDSVIHLAAMAAPRVAEAKPEETFRVNVLGTYNILRMAKEVGVKRVVFASTAHVYGISPKYLPTDEVHPLALLDTYTSSKIMGEQLCHLFYENYNMSYVTLRMFNGYGPRQSLDYFIPAMITKAMKGDIVLQGRHITKDFIYVTDMVDAIMTVLPSDYVGPLNVGSGIQTTLEYVANYIAKAFNVNLTFAETEDKGPTHMQCDNSRLKRFGWSPKISIEEGLSKTIESFKKYNHL